MPSFERRVVLLSWLVVLWTGCVSLGATERQGLAIDQLLTSYERGNYQEVLDSIGRSGSIEGGGFEKFQEGANRWLEAIDPAGRWHRQLVASSAALEMAHLLRDRSADGAAKYLVWASLTIRKTPPEPPTIAEHEWYLAALAGMEELDMPWVLVVGTPGPATLEAIAAKLRPGGLLAICLERFPDDPRFLLARAEASEWLVRAFAELAFAPSRQQFVKIRASASAPEHLDPSDRFTVDQPIAQGLLDEGARLPDVIREFERLAEDPRVASEADLHLGYLEAARQNWSSAVERLRSGLQQDQDVSLRFLTEFFMGRIAAATGNRTGAREAFGQAATLVPKARSATTLLATELLLTASADDRDRAYRLLQAAGTDLTTPDPWALYFHGDARLWPKYMAQLRQALR